jgi:uncharacterized protein
MEVWAIADLHLAFGDQSKSMEVFGPQWKDYAQKISANWNHLITPEDLVLIAGDISWSMRPEQAVKDLAWIDQLPGTKVMIRGNHDYWWSSASKVRKILPPSIHIIQNDVFNFGGFSIAGTRLWDTDEYNFKDAIEFQENPKASAKEGFEDGKIFERELHRLELSLQGLDRSKRCLAMTHYPPIGADLQESRCSMLLERYGVEVCVFGHLHNLKPGQPMFGTKNGIRYLLTSCDFLNFTPMKVLPLSK